jgi:hypothetical protein
MARLTEFQHQQRPRLVGEGRCGGGRGGGAAAGHERRMARREVGGGADARAPSVSNWESGGEKLGLQVGLGKKLEAR